jgi:alpha-methylacyl-CoA racemase
MTSVFGMRQQGHWNPERGTNLIDGGAPFYDVYRTSDGEFVSVAALERRFFGQLVEKLGVADDDCMQDRMNPETWPAMRARFADIFATRTRDQWCALLEGTDCCVAPVLSLEEAPRHPHNAARGTFVGKGNATRPGPAPRFSATPAAAASRPAPRPGEHTDEVLREWGVA